MSFPPQQTVLGERSLTLRYEVTEADISCVRAIVESTGFFHPAETDVAVELVEERLRGVMPQVTFFPSLKAMAWPLRIHATAPSPARLTATMFIGLLFIAMNNVVALGDGSWISRKN